MGVCWANTTLLVWVGTWANNTGHVWVGRCTNNIEHVWVGVGPIPPYGYGWVGDPIPPYVYVEKTWSIQTSLIYIYTLIKYRIL